MDFTFKKYKELLQKLINNGYQFVTFEHYCSHKVELASERFVILRHDVDLDAENSLAAARIEQKMGVKASYYFRIVEESNKPDVIREIAALGHEIGYHYEDMAICDGDVQKAFDHFKKWLAYFRQFYPVRTICMHGAPRSKFDGKELWGAFDYRELGIIGEPYFDVDYNSVFYLTDTGRRWDGFHVSVRDKVPVYQNQWVEEGLVYHSTDDILKAVEEKSLPLRLMMTTHPQRWTDNRFKWWKELLLQGTKNAIKRIIVVKKSSNF